VLNCSGLLQLREKRRGWKRGPLRPPGEERILFIPNIWAILAEWAAGLLG